MHWLLFPIMKKHQIYKHQVLMKEIEVTVAKNTFRANPKMKLWKHKAFQSIF